MNEKELTDEQIFINFMIKLSFMLEEFETLKQRVIELEKERVN